MHEGIAINSRISQISIQTVCSFDFICIKQGWLFLKLDQDDCFLTKSIMFFVFLAGFSGSLLSVFSTYRRFNQINRSINDEI